MCGDQKDKGETGEQDTSKQLEDGGEILFRKQV